MHPDELGRAWARQAQADAERGVIECRMCRRHAGLNETLTLWRNSTLVFAIYNHYTNSHNILLTPTNTSVKVRAQRQKPLIIKNTQ